MFAAELVGQHLILTDEQGRPAARLTLLTSEEASAELACLLTFSVASLEVLPTFAE